MNPIGSAPNTSPWAWLTTIAGVFVGYLALKDLYVAPFWLRIGGLNRGANFNPPPALTLPQFVFAFVLIGVAAGCLMDARMWRLQVACGSALAVVGFVATGWITGLGFGDPYGARWAILDGALFVIAAVVTLPNMRRVANQPSHPEAINVS